MWNIIISPVQSDAALRGSAAIYRGASRLMQGGEGGEGGQVNKILHQNHDNH